MATQEEVAKRLDLTSRWVRHLLKAGVLPVSKGRGGYNLDACTTSYIRYLRGVNSNQINPERDCEVPEV
jgi:terminase small subunit / prophage DNA-packing protein